MLALCCVQSMLSDASAHVAGAQDYMYEVRFVYPIV